MPNTLRAAGQDRVLWLRSQHLRGLSSHPTRWRAGCGDTVSCSWTSRIRLDVFNILGEAVREELFRSDRFEEKELAGSIDKF